MADSFPKQTIFLVECRTGCTCCAYENHYRGPFKTREEAERRAESYRSIPLLASQYARRGVYNIHEETGEILPDGRIISSDRVYEGFAEDRGDDYLYSTGS